MIDEIDSVSGGLAPLLAIVIVRVAAVVTGALITAAATSDVNVSSSVAVGGGDANSCAGSC